MSKELIDAHTLIAQVAEHYQYHRNGNLLSSWQDSITRLLTKFFQHLATLLNFSPAFTDSTTVSNILRWFFYGFGAIALFFLLQQLFIKLSSQRGSQIIRLDTSFKTTTTDWQSWHKQALTFGSASDWKQACRALLLSIISFLAENKVLPLATTCSNYEYWRALSQYKKIQPDFKSLAEIVDYFWFGNRTASEADFRHCLAHFEAIKSSINVQSQ